MASEDSPPSVEREIKFKILEEMFRCSDSEDRSRLRAFVDRLDREIREYREEEAMAEWRESQKEMRTDEDFELDETEEEKEDRESVI